MTPGILHFLSLLSSLLTNNPNVLRKWDDAVPNERDIRIFLQPSASRPDGPDPPFISIAAFKMRDSFISSYTIWWTGRTGHCNNTS